MNEVIIDGVNVAECYFYYKGECRCELNCIDLYKNETITELAIRTPEHNYMECKPSDNCYFKQLQRAKAENERLSELTCVNCGEKFLSPTGSELYEKIVQLKAENEKLKEIIKQAIKDFNHEIGTPYYDKLCENAIKLKIIKECENE